MDLGNGNYLRLHLHFGPLIWGIVLFAASQHMTTVDFCIDYLWQLWDFYNGPPQKGSFFLHIKRRQFLDHLACIKGSSFIQQQSAIIHFWDQSLRATPGSSEISNRHHLGQLSQSRIISIFTRFLDSAKGIFREFLGFDFLGLYSITLIQVFRYESEQVENLNKITTCAQI